MADEREKHEGTEPDEAIREAVKPDPDGAGEGDRRRHQATRLPHEDAQPRDERAQAAEGRASPSERGDSGLGGRV